MTFQTGFFLGTDPTQLASVSAWLGKPVDVLNWSLNRTSWSAWLSSLNYSAGKLAGVTTQVNYTVPLITTGSSLATAAAHGYDSYYVQAAKALLAISGSQDKIVVRVGEEFNGNWMPWAAGGHEADFAQAYRNFVDAFRTVSDKFVFEWNVAIGSTSANPVAAYPGDSYVDIVSGDLYWDSTQSWSVKDPTQAFNYYKNATNGLAWLESFAAAHGKPTAYSEWGMNSDNGAAFIKLVHDWFDSHNVVYESYWNSTSSFNGMLSNGQYPDAAAEFLALFGATATTNPATSASATVSTTPATTGDTATPVTSTAGTPATAVDDTAATAPVTSTGDTSSTTPTISTGDTSTTTSSAGSTSDAGAAATSATNPGADTALAPVKLGALSLPSLVVTPGQTKDLVLTASASSAGDGIAKIVVHLDHALVAGDAGTATLTIDHLSADGSAVAASGIGVASAGAYAITSVDVVGANGETVTYGADQLQAAGVSTSFVVAGNVAADFSGDLRSDMLWVGANGAVSSWSATGGADYFQKGVFNAQVATDWHVVETFDFNGDGHADILWKSDGGQVSVWEGSATGFVAGAYTSGAVSSDWHVAGTGDLDGDGKGDIVWQSSTGAVSTWLSTGTGFQQNAYYHAPVAAGWTIEGLGDFNGDGKSDLLWRSADGALSTWNSNGTGFAENSWFHGNVATSWHVVGIGDFDGDGKSDILWKNDSGAVSVWTANAAGGFDESKFNAAVSAGWHVAEVGDFNGDGRADILWQNADGAISTWESTGSGFTENTHFDASTAAGWQVVSHDFAL